MDKKLFGTRINKARKDRGLTAEKLAEACNINSTYLRQIEGGKKLPSLPVFATLTWLASCLLMLATHLSGWLPRRVTASSSRFIASDTLVGWFHPSRSLSSLKKATRPSLLPYSSFTAGR